MDEVRKTKYFELGIFIYFTMLMSGASSIGNNDLFRVSALGMLVIYAILKHRLLFNRVLFAIMLLWVVINIIASLYLNESINYYPFIGKMVLLYTAFLILSCCGVDFWCRYENFLYKLVVFSFFIYLSSLLLPSLFNSLTSVFRPFTDDVFYQKESQQNYFYSFFFVYRGGDVLFRNNGFMWEPGAYAMVLIFLIVYNISKYGLQMNTHIKMYSIALFSTFSTLGYLCLFVLVLLFVLRGRNIYLKFVLLLLFFIASTWLINADFLLPKVERFIEAAQAGEVSHQGYRDFYEANRILSFKLLVDKFFIFPLGWGCVRDAISYMSLSHILTVNGLGSILVTWGIFVCSFFIYSIWKFFYQSSNSMQIASVALIVLLMTFFSNPIENNIFFYVLVFSPYTLVVKTRKYKYNR